MNSNINLLQQKDDQLIKKQKRLKILKLIAGILLATVALFSIIIFILNTKFSVTSIKNEQNSVINSISALKAKAAKMILVNDRIKGTSEILKKRKDYTSLIQKVLNSVPGEAKTAGLDINKDSLNMSVSSNSLLSIDTYLENMIKLSQEKKLIKNLVIKGINVNFKNGEFILSVNATIL
ncbi:MAG TPA: hypothetical protein VFD45_02965 [Patescibacteria group bacterium]|nr:hypothetical protein [Patescibacteria group bacterium]